MNHLEFFFKATIALGPVYRASAIGNFAKLWCSLGAMWKLSLGRYFVTRDSSFPQ